MLIDREGYIDVIDNRDGFRKDGLDLEVVYNSIVGAGWTGFYLDPKDRRGSATTPSTSRTTLPRRRS